MMIELSSVSIGMYWGDPIDCIVEVKWFFDNHMIIDMIMMMMMMMIINMIMIMMTRECPTG